MWDPLLSWVTLSWNYPKSCLSKNQICLFLLNISILFSLKKGKCLLCNLSQHFQADFMEHFNCNCFDWFHTLSLCSTDWLNFTFTVSWVIISIYGKGIIKTLYMDNYLLRGFVPFSFSPHWKLLYSRYIFHETFSLNVCSSADISCFFASVKAAICKMF